MGSRRGTAALVVVLVACAPGARADDEAWEPVTAGPLASLTAPLTAPGRLTLQPLLVASSSRGALDEDGRPIALADAVSRNGLVGQLYLEVGLVDDVAVGGQLTAGSNLVVVEDRAVSAAGFGDTLVFARYALPSSRRIEPLLSLIAQVGLPTGGSLPRDPALLGADVFGSGAIEPTLGLNATTYRRPFVWHLDVFASLPLEGDAAALPTWASPVIAWSAASEVPLGGGRFVFLVEATGRHQVGAVGAGGEQQVTVGGGVEVIFTEDLQLLVGYTRTLAGRNTLVVDTLVATVVPTL